MRFLKTCAVMASSATASAVVFAQEAQSTLTPEAVNQLNQMGVDMFDIGGIMIGVAAISAGIGWVIARII